MIINNYLINQIVIYHATSFYQMDWLNDNRSVDWSVMLDSVEAKIKY